MLEVVEDDEHVGEHQRHVRQPEHVGVRLAERLDGADEVVAEVADRAAGERRQVGQRRLAVARRPPRAAIAYGSPSSPSDQRSTARGRTPMNE